MKEKEFVTAIVLAAGRGTRMGTKIQKQYLDLCGKPVLYYSLHAFQESPLIDEILLVTGEQEIEYCRKEIVEKYQLTKVRKILAGGAERYLSVWNGIQAAENKGCLFIHDGARPFVDEEMIERVYEQVQKEKACVVGMPVKDTIKIADEKEYVQTTPDRSTVWMIQTPQVFSYDIVKGAYEMLMREQQISVTDDAMVVEQMLNHPIRLVYGSYENIKITTPEDLEMAEVFFSHASGGKLAKKPGVEELLKYLKAKGFKIGLASSTREALVRSEISDGGLLGYFDQIIGGDMVERRNCGS